MANYEQPPKMIDNDFHPEDRLSNDADQGYWGKTSQVNRDAKGDMPAKTGYGNKGSNRYGGADFPTGGANERHFYNNR